MKRYSRRAMLRTLAGALATLPFGRGVFGQERPPNVVFIMTDDQQRDALSAYGNTVLKTPNMDRIAAEGMRFDQMFVTCSLCAPSRASFLTGLYPHTHGITTNGDGPQFYNGPGLRRDQPTFVHYLREAGYQTALVGKWHLKSRPEGFDQWVIFPWQGEYRDPEMIAGGVPLRMRGHADDVVGDQALQFLRTRPRDRPFLPALSVQITAPELDPRATLREGVCRCGDPPPARIQ